MNNLTIDYYYKIANSQKFLKYIIYMPIIMYNSKKRE